MNSTWKSIIYSQFGAAIDMLDNAMRACPVELWRERVHELEFWYVAYHTLFWLDLYLDGSEEGFAPPAPFTLIETDPDEKLPEQPYSKDELHAYLEHCRAKCRATILALTDEQAQRRCKFPRRELSFMELLLYNMRHVQEHASQLSLVLGQRGVSAPGWVGRAKS